MSTFRHLIHETCLNLLDIVFYILHPQITPGSLLVFHHMQALDFQQDDKSCLVARSHCYLQLGDNAAALKDAEDSLNENKKYYKGLCQKAEVLYAMGNFEHALVFYHRGHSVRPQMHEFTLGIQKAQEAINNSIGSKTINLYFNSIVNLYEIDQLQCL